MWYNYSRRGWKEGGMSWLKVKDEVMATLHRYGTEMLQLRKRRRGGQQRRRSVKGPRKARSGRGNASRMA